MSITNEQIQAMEDLINSNNFESALFEAGLIDEFMEDLINSNNFESALFEAGLIDEFMVIDEFCDLYEELPQTIQNLIDGSNAEYEATFDREYWGSDSVVQIRIQACDKTWNTEIETWKEENEVFYAEWCDKAEKAIWRHIQRQNNFKVFDMAMRGKRL